jgi:hypothetical protein
VESANDGWKKVDDTELMSTRGSRVGIMTSGAISTTSDRRAEPINQLEWIDNSRRYWKVSAIAQFDNPIAECFVRTWT